MPDTIGSANGFTINVPSFDGSGSGFDFNFDYGTTPNAQAQQAYDFVQSSFNQDQGFLQSAISGSQAFLSHQIAPVLNATTTQLNNNATMLPSLYDMLQKSGSDAIKVIASQTSAGISSVEAMAQQSIAASNAAAGAGGCFITTVICEWRGESDDCATLRELRHFRDSYMLPNHPDEVEEYYKIAPPIVDKIESSESFDYICSELYNQFLKPCRKLLHAKQYESARNIYKAMIDRAKALTHVS